MHESKVFVPIHNKSNYLINEIPSLHPESAKYKLYWRLQKRRIVEGCWIPDTKDINIDLNDELDYINLTEKINHNWRWIPPGLYFYVNFGTILHKPEGAPRTTPKKKIRPYLSDFELAFHFNWIEARGFSGFEDDDEFSCNRDLVEYKSKDHFTLHESCYNSSGHLKEYIPARDYLRKLNTKPLGRPLYFNSAKNLMLVGSRGGGKSFLAAVSVGLHEIITNGIRYYTEDNIKNPPLNEIFVGSSMASKSSELLQKTKIAMDTIPGAWKPGTIEERPSPLYKHMSGTLSPNNIKNPWRHEYSKKVGGEWKNVGSGSCIKHAIFTSENPEASAGGRYSVIIVEEVGLVQNMLTVHGSNTATQVTDGVDKYGSSLYIGTGGNVSKIIETELIFRDPKGFDMLEFDDEWEGTGKICWFVPAYYMDRKCKDAEGNTIIDQAYSIYENVRKEKKKAKSGSALELEMLNYPLVPSEMFLSRSSNKFPIADLKHSLSELLTSKLLDASWKGEFIINGEGKITWKNLDRNPIREFPVRDAANIEGCWEIFQMPVFVNDSIPFGRYGASLDPVDDDDNADKSRSLQSCFIIDFFTDTIVAEYTGRTQFAKDFYEQVRRAMVYYNCRLLYENNKKGVFAYFDQKNSLHLLEDTPEMLKDMDMQKLVAVGNKSKGVYMNEALINFGVDLYSQWLMSQANGKIEGVTNAHVLRSVGLIRESLVWSKDINADRVSSIIILMILRETKIKQIESRQKAVNKPSLNKDEFWMKHYNTKNQQRMMYGAMNSYTDSRVFNNNN